jgi:chromate reductase
MYLIFVSSLVKNVEISKLVDGKLKSHGKETKIINLVELDLPMYDSYKEEHDGIPRKILDLIPIMEEAEGYVFVSPEYNFSLPPVHVNAIAWLSRIGDDFRKLFALKYIQLATHSGGGGQDVSNAMRTQFTKLGSIVMPREIIATFQNEVREDSVGRIIDQFVKISSK